MYSSNLSSVCVPQLAVVVTVDKAITNRSDDWKQPNSLPLFSASSPGVHPCVPEDVRDVRLELAGVRDSQQNGSPFLTSGA
jgi:hypothetical protein